MESIFCPEQDVFPLFRTRIVCVCVCVCLNVRNDCNTKQPNIVLAKREGESNEAIGRAHTNSFELV